MNLPIVFMYSGQGSQYYQMGLSFYNENALFRESMLAADQVCRDYLSLSVIENLYSPNAKKSDPLQNILLTHPAILMVEYAMTQVLLENHIQPTKVLGTSMGEFAASTTANVIDFESALQMVIKQAQAFHAYSEQGGMIAILHEQNLYDNEKFLHDYSSLAARNFPTHFVISAKQENLVMIADTLKKKNITYQILPVMQAFHSPWIENVKEQIINVKLDITLQNATLPYISCVNADRKQQFSFEYYWDIVREPIQFQKAIEFLETQSPAYYLDLGPSGTLATFVKYNLQPQSISQFAAIMNPYGSDSKNLAAIIEALK